MNYTELLAAALALAGIGLMVLRKNFGWWLNFASCLLYAGLFFRSKLYGDGGLQLFFAVMQVSGWLNWKKHSKHKGLLIREMSLDAVWNTLLFTLGGSLLLGYLLYSNTDARAPWIDAFCTMGSITGQWLQVARYRENWWYWVVVNLIYVPLYVQMNLYLTAVLYGVFLGLAIAGMMRWNNILKQQKEVLQDLS